MDGVSLPHPADIPQGTLDCLTAAIRAIEAGLEAHLLPELLLARIALDLSGENHTLDEYADNVGLVAAALVLEQMRRSGRACVVGEYLPWERTTQWVGVS